jgi:hypothetical protein
MRISGNYTLKVNPDWRNVQLDELYLECDTSGGPVNIQLFEIAELEGFRNLKIYVSDISGNAETNNIRITAGGSNIIDSLTDIAIDINNGVESLSVVNENQWMAISSETSTGPVGPGPVEYSNVIFVDPVFGNDLTATAGRFDLPYREIQSAINFADSLHPTTNARALVWIRKGGYANKSLTLKNNVDVYCDPGVVFTGNCTIRDTGADVNMAWKGSASWNCSYNNMVFQFVQSSTISITGLAFYNTGGCGAHLPGDGAGVNVTYNFETIESVSGNGTGFLFTWRGIVTGTVNAKTIKCGHEQHDLRSNHSGTVIVNCPVNIQSDNNQYGGNFSQFLNDSGTSANSEFILNGDIFNEISAYRGGIQCTIVQFSNASGKITINGNIYSLDERGLWQSGTATAKMTLNGNIVGERENVYKNQNGDVILNNSIAEVTGVQNLPNFYCAGPGGWVTLNGVLSSNENVDQDIIDKETSLITTNAGMSVFNSSLTSAGLLGNVANSNNPGTAIQFVGTVSNKTLNANVSNSLATGFVVEASLVTPKI